MGPLTVFWAIFFAVITIHVMAKHAKNNEKEVEEAITKIQELTKVWDENTEIYINTGHIVKQHLSEYKHCGIECMKEVVLRAEVLPDGGDKKGKLYKPWFKNNQGEWRMKGQCRHGCPFQLHLSVGLDPKQGTKPCINTAYVVDDKHTKNCQKSGKSH